MFYLRQYLLLNPHRLQYTFIVAMNSCVVAIFSCVVAMYSCVIVMYTVQQCVEIWEVKIEINKQAIYFWYSLKKLT